MKIKKLSKLVLTTIFLSTTLLLTNISSVNATDTNNQKPTMIVDGHNYYNYSYTNIKIDNSITLGNAILKEKLDGITVTRTVKDGYGKDDINYNLIVDKAIFKQKNEIGYYDKYLDSNGNITIPVYVEIPNNILYLYNGTGTQFFELKLEKINGKNYFKYDKTIRWNNLSLDDDFSVEIEDGQDICYIFDDGEGEAVIWKRLSNAIVFNRILVNNTIEETSTEIKNKETNIELTAEPNVIPSNTIMETQEIKEEKTLKLVKESLKDFSNKFISYDITLKSDGVLIQPNGKVKISIPIPNGYDKTKLSIFRISNNGTKVKYDTKIENNFAIIETDHFSTYVLAENNIAKTENTETDTKTDIDTLVTTTTNKEKDSTPKTGTFDIISYVVLATALSGISILILRKGKK